MIERNPIDARLAIVPLIPPLIFLVQLLDNPTDTVGRWIQHFSTDESLSASSHLEEIPSVGSQLLAYLTMAVLGYYATWRMVPTIKEYTLRQGISGRDLGKKGTVMAEKEV